MGTGPAVPVCQRWARGAGPLLEEGPEEVVVGDFGRQRLVVILQEVKELLLGEVDTVLPQDLPEVSHAEKPRPALVVGLEQF